MKRLRQVLPLFSLALVAMVLPVQALDMSDYRQSTYGAPTRYCNPARALSSNGAGTLADPWNMTQCAQLPVAGDIVGLMPGISVPIQSSGNSRYPAFRPSNSGTASARIIYVTKYPAIALSGVETNANRTEFRHNGGAPYITGGVGAGTGGPMLGANGTNYVTFDGFYIDMAQAYESEDSGVLHVESATGVQFKNFVIKGARLTVASNATVYRSTNVVDTVMSNFRMYDFVNNGTGSATPQEAFAVMTYGDRNLLIEHYEIRNIDGGIRLKGTAPAGVNFNYATIRYGIVSGGHSCARFNDLDPTRLTTVEYNICYDQTDSGGIFLTNETSVGRNILIHHNTIARMNSASFNTQGGIYSRALGVVGSNVTVRDNVIDINYGSYGHMINYAEQSTLPASQDYNAFTRNGSSISWAFNNVQYNSLAAWQAATGRDARSFVMTTSPFTNRAGGVFTIVAGHPAKTGSSTGGEMGAYAGPELPGTDGISVPPPAAPTNLRVTP